MMRGSSGRCRKRILVVVVFLAIPGFWVLSWLLTVGSSYLGTWSDRGSFGDMFGAVGALFSGLAFAGVILTVYYQTQELRLQRAEVEQTRAAVEQTSEYLSMLAEEQQSTQRAMCRQSRILALSAVLSAASRSRVVDSKDVNVNSIAKSLHEEAGDLLKELQETQMTD